MSENKISKEEFVIYTATHVIMRRSMKSLTSVQRKKLRLKKKEGEEIQRLTAHLFCQAHFRQAVKLGFPEPNVKDLVRLWGNNTKNERMELCARAVEFGKRQEMIKQYMAEHDALEQCSTEEEDPEQVQRSTEEQEQVQFEPVQLEQVQEKEPDSEESL